MILAPFLKWIAGGLLFVTIILGIALKMEKIHSAKQAVQISKLAGELKRISTERNEQREETGERIKVATRTIGEADKRAEVVEKAPLPGQCRTPAEVMGADL